MYHYSNQAYKRSDPGRPPSGSPLAPTPARRTKYLQNNEDSNFNNNIDQVTPQNGSDKSTSSGYPQYTQATVRVPHGNRGSLHPFSPTSPPNTDQILNHTAESWDYLQANLNLTPHEGHRSRSNIPNGYSTGTGSIRRESPSPIRSRVTMPLFSPSDKTKYGNDEHSPVSKDSGKENSELSTVSPRNDEAQDVSRTSVGSIVASGGEVEGMTYRARWERSRRERRDSAGSNVVRSVSEPNRGTHAGCHSREDSGNSVFTYENTPRSRSCDYAEKNRSLLSSHRDIFLGQDANRSALTDRSVLSAMSYSNYMDTSNNGSLRRDPVTHRKISNGATKSSCGTPDGMNEPLQRQRSINLSRISLSSRSKDKPKVTVYGRDYGVHNSLIIMAFYALLSLVLGILSWHLLLKLSSREAESLLSTDSVLSSNSSYQQVRIVCVACSSLVLMLNLSCFLTCAIQAFFAAKLVKCHEGEERAFKYIKECSGTRSIAFTGFFVSIPVFLLAVMLYVIMEYPATAAIVGVVVITVGLSFSICTMIHAFAFWRTEKNKADSRISVYNESTPKPETRTEEKAINRSELSTLV